MAGAMAPFIVAFAGAWSLHLATGEASAGEASSIIDDWSWSGDGSGSTMLTQPSQHQASLLGEEPFEVSNLQSWGVEVADMDPNAQGGQQTETAYFATVCERTRQALFATVPDSPSPNKLLGGPVYGECTSSLASERRGSVGGDAVSVLHDCMALVDALVSKLSSDYSATASTNVCSDLAAALHVAGSQPAAPPPVPTVVLSASSPTAARAEHSSVQGPALPPQPDAHAGDALIPKTQRERPPVTQAAAAPASQGALRTETMQIVLVAKRMTDVCIETVQAVEAGIKAETDALELGNVTAACEGAAKKNLGSFVALPGTMTQAVHGWCSELDGRLMLALEAGFLFALEPDDAQRQAGRTNPYALATRRQFCDRFAASVQQNALQRSRSSETATPAQTNVVHVAVTQQPHTAVMPAVASPPPAAATTQQLPQHVVKPQPQQVATTGNLRGSEDKGRSAGPADAGPVHAAAVAAHPTTAAAAQSAHAAAPAVPPTVELHAKAPQAASGSTEERKAQGSVAPKAGIGMEMFRLVQTLSAKPDWSSCCIDLLVGLAAKEGSITDADALKRPAVESGVEVLTFNGADQSNIGRCASRLEGIAGKLGILSMLSLTKSDAADNDVTTKKEQQAFIKSPWAADACSDIAHAFLTMELAHPGTKPPQFCQLYSKKLQTMKTARNDAAAEKEKAARDDVARLKQRAKERAMRGMSHAITAKVQTHRPDAILAVVKPGAPTKVPRSADSAAAVAAPSALAGETPIQAAKTSVPTADAENSVATSASDDAPQSAAASDSGAASDSKNPDDEAAASFWRGQIDG